MINESILSVTDLSVSYWDGPVESIVVESMRLAFAKGSWTAVVGANGSGKSTLARAMAGLIGIRTGSMEIATGNRIHIVLQNPETQLLGDTIREEFELSLKHRHAAAHVTTHDSQLLNILKEAGLQMPLDTPIHQLSGGQKQLLNIACCLILEADVLILDEATSMLDPASRELVLSLIRRLHRNGKTVIWITHRTEELVYADRVLLLEQGKIAFDDSVRQFCYGNTDDTVSPCEQHGMTLPYVVQVVRQLERRGLQFGQQPLHPEELGQAVAVLCR